MAVQRERERIAIPQRKAFADVLRGAGVYVESEYQQLVAVFFGCLVGESYGRKKTA